MDLNELLIFTRVVEAGSFTAGARLLAMPKSSVSRKIAELEDRLAARLLQRTTRKLGLTDAGRVYYEHCARIVAAVAEAEQAVGRLQAVPCGLLRVSVPLALPMLGPIAAEFLKRYPQVQLELSCTDRVVDLVAEGFDLAIRAGVLFDSTLVARSLGVIERVLIAAPAYLKRHGTPRTPAELAGHACITFAAGPTPTLWTLLAGERKVELTITSRLAVNDFAMMSEAARAGIGIAWIPKFVCRAELQSGALRQILADWCSAATPVHAVYPSTRHLSPKVIAFYELVRDRLSLDGPSRSEPSS